MPAESHSSIAQPTNKGVDRVFQSKRQLMLANFLGGISWGFGSVIGATLVVALLVTILNLLGTLPFIGQAIQHTITDSVSEGINRAK